MALSVSLCFEIGSWQDVDEAYRKSLYDFANEHGNHALHEKLKDIDPASYESIQYKIGKAVWRLLGSFSLIVL